MINKHYNQFLKLEYFNSKPITELTNDQILEFMKLKIEVLQEWNRLSRLIKKYVKI